MRDNFSARRRLAAALGVLLAAAVAPAAAQDWPVKPIRIIVGAGVGGGTDIFTRILAQPLSEVLGQPVVVENKPGAGNILAADSVTKAPKDGYTLYMMNNAHGVAAALYKSLPFDPVNDYAMVALVGGAGLVMLASPQFPAKDVAGAIAAVKAAPGKYNFASVAVGSTQHFAGELFRQTAGLDIKHIPYRGTPAVVAALRTNEVQLTFELVQPVLGQVRAGDLKALAVTSAQRFPALPDVPTVAESGLADFQVVSWYGLAFPAGTPAPIVDKLNKALKDVLARDSVRQQILGVGATAQISTPEKMRQHIENEIVKWRAVREKAGIAQQ